MDECEGCGCECDCGMRNRENDSVLCDECFEDLREMRPQDVDEFESFAEEEIDVSKELDKIMQRNDEDWDMRY